MGFFINLLLALAGIDGDDRKQQKSGLFSDREFKDYRDKWGSNNDHNWEADGDTRWDSYDD